MVVAVTNLAKSRDETLEEVWSPFSQILQKFTDLAPSRCRRVGTIPVSHSVALSVPRTTELLCVANDISM